CSYCDQVFQDEAALSKHIKIQHTRPFKCVFHFAGCELTFALKAEWKRHHGQHLLLDYWVCEEGECSSIYNGNNLPNGSIFARKDLFTQHLRRMHMPPQINKSGSRMTSKSHQTNENTRVAQSAWEDSLRRLQEQGLRSRCELPEHLKCPADSCLGEFFGPDAWDQRMEHVSRHLERAWQGREREVQFGGPNDELFVEWASSPEVGIIQLREGNWVL
ncbi:hypothetical protein V8F20_003578, partial [Naviculisporaceae sp. PSN 640]